MKRGHFKSSVLLAALLVCPSWANQAPGSVDGQTAVGEKVHSGALVSPAARAEIRAAASLVEKGKFAEAEAHARRSVELAPMSAEAQNLLGIICDQLGRAAEAEKAYDTALRLEPHLVSARNNLGNLLAREGHAEQARVAFERVLRLDPKYVQAHFNLGTLLAAAGEYGKAADQFAAVRRLRGDDPAVLIAFLNAALRAGRIEESLRAAEEAARRSPRDAPLLFTLGSTMAQNSQYEAAAGFFARVNEVRPSSYEVLYNLGLARFNLKQYDDAAAAFAQAADIDPHPPEAHFRLALIASEHRDLDNSILELDHAARRSPDRADYHYLLGREYFRAGNWDAAAASYQRAVDLD